MALNKFLFTTDENTDYLTGNLNKAATATGSASESMNNFSGNMLKKASTTVPGPGGTANFGIAAPGQALLGGFSWLGSKAVGGASSLLSTIEASAKRVLFQEMYLNPDKFDMSYTIPVSKIETAGGVIIHPWRPELPVVNMSGIVGWIRDESMLNSAVNRAAAAFISGGGSPGSAASAFASSFSAFGGKVSNLGALQRFRENARKLSNSPRKFLENLRAMVLSPMYYVSNTNPKLEKFNTKKIVAFTKQYPDGATFSGYFTKFDIDESGKDPETLRYNLEFVVFNIQPIGIQERLGQFIAPFYGTALELGRVGSNVASNLTRF